MVYRAAQTNDEPTKLPACGVIGTGSIGASVATRLASLGVPVSAFDIDAARVSSLAEHGVAAAASPKALAQHAEIVLLALPNTPDVLAVLAGEDGLETGLSQGTCVLLMSTVDPDAARSLSSRLAPLGVELLDTPVSGGPVAASAGTLTIMVGGSDAGFARCRTLLECLGDHVVHVGPVGHGETTKLVNNLMGAVIAIGIAEGLTLAAKAGIDVERARQAIVGGSGSSWILSEWIPRTALGDPSQTHFAVDLMCKDMGLVRDLAASLDVPLQAGALAQRTFAELQQAGDGGRDFSVLLTRRAEAAGTTLPHAVDQRP